MVVPHKRTRSDVLLTRSPLAIREQALYAAVRLACVKHAASVQSEPGSNSSVQFLFLRLSAISNTKTSLALKWNRKFPSLLPFFSARRFISSLTLYFRSSHTDRFVAKFLKNFFCLPLGATRFGILHKSEPFCKFRNFLSVPCSLASFVRFLFRSLAARGRIISAFSALSIADFANHNLWGFLFLTH